MQEFFHKYLFIDINQWSQGLYDTFWIIILFTNLLLFTLGFCAYGLVFVCSDIEEKHPVISRVFKWLYLAISITINVVLYILAFRYGRG